MNDIDCAWVAGIFEGEGAATKNLDGKGKIQFDNTDRTMLEAVAGAIGYGDSRIHAYPYSESAMKLSPSKKDSAPSTFYRLYVLDPEIIKQIYPFVRSKNRREKLEGCFPFLLHE